MNATIPIPKKHVRTSETVTYPSSLAANTSRSRNADTDECYCNVRVVGTFISNLANDFLLEYEHTLENGMECTCMYVAGGSNAECTLVTNRLVQQKYDEDSRKDYL